ncbi:MAG TPA: AbrB/MazE/SpoVT family DNA-binding domain-containing protein [Candidatus Chromulinivoraceae bacterium]|nr:AbrB/MazE/SpoVT family DNA-binding domain-containing protein [Candidatus Chromulinivoraceae bacterium]
MGKPLTTDKKLYGTSTVGTKGQIVIPSDAREELDIKPGDRMYVMSAMHGAGVVLLKEEMLESFVEEMMAQVEVFRTLKKKENKE